MKSTPRIFLLIVAHAILSCRWTFAGGPQIPGSHARITLTHPNSQAALHHILDHIPGISRSAFQAGQDHILAQIIGNYSQQLIARQETRFAARIESADVDSVALTQQFEELVPFIELAAPEQQRAFTDALEKRRLYHAISAIGMLTQRNPQSLFDSLPPMSPDDDLDATSAKALAIDGQKHPDLVLTPKAEFTTTILHRREGLLGTAPGPVVVLFGGTGNKSRYSGIEASMGPMADRLHSLGANPIAFQNPLYFEDTRPDSERRATVESYGSLAAQTHWMAKVLEYVVSRNPVAPDGKSTRPVIVGTRSTGSGLFLQLLHDYIAGRPYANVIEKISLAMPMGIVGHTETEIAVWHAREHSDRLDDPARADPLVWDKGVPLFTPMDWAPLQRGPIFRENPQRLPKLIAVVGANDPLSTAAMQIRILERFTRQHPQLDISFAAFDTGHNPAAAISYRTRENTDVSVPRLERIKSLLEILLQPMAYAPGLRSYFHPAFWDAPGVDPSDETIRRHRTGTPEVGG